MDSDFCRAELRPESRTQATTTGAAAGDSDSWHYSGLGNSSTYLPSFFIHSCIYLIFTEHHLGQALRSTLGIHIVKDTDMVSILMELTVYLERWVLEKES